MEDVTGCLRTGKGRYLSAREDFCLCDGEIETAVNIKRQTMKATVATITSRKSKKINGAHVKDSSIKVYLTCEHRCDRLNRSTIGRYRCRPIFYFITSK